MTTAPFAPAVARIRRKLITPRRIQALRDALAVACIVIFSLSIPLMLWLFIVGLWALRF